MCPKKTEKTRKKAPVHAMKSILDKVRKSSELTTIRTRYLAETVKQLQTQVEELELELGKVRRIPSGKIGLTFLVPGALSIIFSILNDLQVLAFVGLGLTFWGALFFFVRPISYIRSSLLGSNVVSLYSNIDRIAKDLKITEKSYYIPPYPKGVYLPEHLKALKDMIVYIPANSGVGLPSIEEMAKGNLLLKNPNGICVSPPGLGLLHQFEKELGSDITKMELSELCEGLSQLILESFHLAKEIRMKPGKDAVHVTIFNSAYKDLYRKEENLKSVYFLGCPLTSAIACAIAKNTGKTIIFRNDQTSPDGEIMEVWYRFAEG